MISLTPSVEPCDKLQRFRRNIWKAIALCVVLRIADAAFGLGLVNYNQSPCGACGDELPCQPGEHDMITIKTTIRTMAVIAGLTASVAMAHGYQAGSLAIQHPWARETAPAQTTGGGYLTIANNGSQEDRLVSASSPAAAQVQIHTMSMDHGVMRMRQVTGGLAIPAHGTLSFQPGGMHLMFVGLRHPLRRGDRVPATLRFQRAGNVQVEFQISAIDAAPPAGGHDHMNMPGMDMDHGGH